MSQAPSESTIIFGFALVLLAAVMNGAYAIPMRFMSRWKWENIWLIWTMLSLWVLPVLMTVAAVPHPVEVYAQTSWGTLLRMALMGLLWGTGVLLLGMSFPRVGVAVGAAVGLGCAAAMGTLLPVLYGNAPPLSRSTSISIALGVLAVLLGVAICGYAGRARELRQATGTMILGRSLQGFLLAAVGGTLTAALNLALAAGSSISISLLQQEPSPSISSIAVWLPVLIAGGIPGILYTSILLSRNSTAGLFRIEKSTSYWPLILMMAGLWLGSIVVYGNGVTKIGALGLVVGWPTFMSGAVIASAAWGAAFGEWKGAGFTAKISVAAGVLCLMMAITILSRAGH